jgi:transposase InsO family protein
MLQPEYEAYKYSYAAYVKVQTTFSNHWLTKYPNLIREFVPKSINQLWVRNITYWKITTGERLYISLITDAWYRKIVGYHVAETMEAIHSIKALQMALAPLGGAAVPLQLTLAGQWYQDLHD